MYVQPPSMGTIVLALGGHGFLVVGTFGRALWEAVFVPFREGIERWNRV